MHGGSSGGGKKARIEIIPLIDVIMFLLATFVLFTLSMNKTQGKPVNAPDAKTATAFDPSKLLTISIDAEGTLYWDKEQMDDWGFFLRQLEEYAKTEDPKVLFNVDRGADFGKTMVVMDEIRKAGLKQISIVTKLPPQQK